MTFQLINYHMDPQNLRLELLRVSCRLTNEEMYDIFNLTNKKKAKSFINCKIFGWIRSLYKMIGIFILIFSIGKLAFCQKYFWLIDNSCCGFRLDRRLSRHRTEPARAPVLCRSIKTSIRSSFLSRTPVLGINRPAAWIERQQLKLLPSLRYPSISSSISARVEEADKNRIMTGKTAIMNPCSYFLSERRPFFFLVCNSRASSPYHCLIQRLRM